MVTKEAIISRSLGRRERKRIETREKLIQAALQLIAKNGFAATRVEEITEAADVAKGTFFNYFPSKEHLLMELVGRQVGKIERCLERAREGKEPIGKLLHTLAHELIELPSRTPELARGMMASFLSIDAVRTVVCDHIAKRGREVLAEIVKIGQQRQEIRADLPAYEIARAYQQSMFGTILLWSLDPVGPVIPILDHSMEVLWNGVKLAGARKTKKA